MMKDDGHLAPSPDETDDQHETVAHSTSTMQPLEIMKPLVHSDGDDFRDEDSFSEDHPHRASLSHSGGATTTTAKSSTAQLTVNIIISFVGAGLLGMPFAFQKAGWLLGSIALMVTSALNVYAMLRIPAVRTRLVQQQAQQDDHPDDTTAANSVTISDYSDLGYILLGGSTGRVIVQIALAISQTGFATAYIIFIAANVEQIFGLARSLTCVLCLPGLCLLVQAPDMTKLATFSLFANLSNLVGLTAVLWVDLQTILARDYHADHQSSITIDPTGNDDHVIIDDDAKLWVDDDAWNQNDDYNLRFLTDSNLLAGGPNAVDHPQNHDVVVEAIKWSGLLYVMSITLYSMEGVGLVLSLERSCAEPARFGFHLQRTVGAITIFMAIFGSLGYAAFGDDTAAPITLNLSSSSSSIQGDANNDENDNGNTAAHVVQSALCIALYLTYPVMMFPVWKIAADTISLSSSTPPSRTIGNFPTQTLLRMSIVVMTTLVAYAIPNFGEFLSLVGSSLCTLLGFVWPCYFHHQVFGKERPSWQQGLDWFLMIGGAVFGVVGTYQSAMNLLSDENTDDNGTRRY